MLLAPILPVFKIKDTRLRWYLTVSREQVCGHKGPGMFLSVFRVPTSGDEKGSASHHALAPLIDGSRTRVTVMAVDGFGPAN